MNKNDLDILTKFWIEIEQNFYSKARHLLLHFQQWQQAHGPIEDDSPLLPSIKRMLEAAALYEGNGDE